MSLFVAFGCGLSRSSEPRYRLADQVPDREQALDATGRIDQKLTGANPVHVMIEWKDGDAALSRRSRSRSSPRRTNALEKEAGLGNVWSLESLRRWLTEAGDDRIETVQKFVGFLPEHLVRRFIAKEQNAVLVTGRLPGHRLRARSCPWWRRSTARSTGPRKQYPDYHASRSPACRRSPRATARA